jgi:hypothetical protein
VTTIVVYCPRCDYFKKVAVQVVGTHGCHQCNGMMEVYIPQELAFERTQTPVSERSQEPSQEAGGEGVS